MCVHVFITKGLVWFSHLVVSISFATLRTYCYQARFICLRTKQGKQWEVEVCSKKWVYHESVKWGERTNHKSTSPKTRDSVYLWDKEAEWPEVWGAWGKVIVDFKKWDNCPSVQAQLSYPLPPGIHAQNLVAIAHWGQGSRASDGQWSPIKHAYPGTWSVLPTSLNWLGCQLVNSWLQVPEKQTGQTSQDS